MPWIAFLLPCKCSVLQLLLLINWNIPVLYWSNSSPANLQGTKQPEGRKRLHSSTSSCLCFTFLIMCIFLPLPKALGNICVHKSSTAGFSISETAPGQLGKIVDYHIEKEEQCVTVPWVLIQISFSSEIPDLALQVATFGHFCLSLLYWICGCAVL